mgnify:CR=1 FL=1
MINRLITHIKSWLADYYENIVIMFFATLFAIGLAFAWNWNSSNYVTRTETVLTESRLREQLDKVTWQLKQSEQRIDQLFEITRRLGN